MEKKALNLHFISTHSDEQIFLFVFKKQENKKKMEI